MSVVARLAGFAGLLAVAFVGALFLGRAADPGRAGDGARAEATMGHGDAAEDAHASTAEAAPVRGLAVSDAGLTLALNRTAVPRGRRVAFAFQILDSAGAAVREFEVEHERRMHLIVVRRDGQGFQHLHPEMDGRGNWTVPLTLPEAGSYRVFADFTTHGRTQTLAADIAVGPASYRRMPSPAREARTSTGYRVELAGADPHAGEEATLAFTVRRGGRPVRVEPYLGAGGHLVALREGDLAYLHTHPAGESLDTIEFGSTFPSAGAYRLFLQFKHAGRVHTAAFTREVQR